MTTATITENSELVSNDNRMELVRRALAILATPLARRDAAEAASVFAPRARFGGPASASCQSSTPVFDIEGAFSGLRIEIGGIEVDGERALARLSVSGQHTGTYRGHDASGAIHRAEGVVSMHITEHRIDQVWCFLRWAS